MKADNLKLLVHRKESLELEWENRYRTLKQNVVSDKDTSLFERNLINELLVMQEVHSKIQALNDSIELLKTVERLF